MAAIAILTIIAIIGTAVVLDILWRVLIFALKLAFVLVFLALLIKAIAETIWGVILIVCRSLLWVAEHIINLFERIRRKHIAVRRRKFVFAR